MVPRQTRTKEIKSRIRARGAVLAEYVIILTTIALPTMFGCIAGGRAMLAEYQEARADILRSVP